MKQSAIRDPQTDPLLTPENAVFVFIDYQPEQFDGVTSRPQNELLLNVTALGKIAKEFAVPSILTTVGVSLGVNRPTIHELKDALAGTEEIDRTTLNAWEDAEFLKALKKTGRRRIVISGLWTEVCVAFPALDAIREGYDVYPVVDALGGVTSETHSTALTRMIQAGAHPITTLALACELQRDWARGDGVALRGIARWYLNERERMPHAA